MNISEVTLNPSCFKLLSSYASRSVIRLRALLKQIMFHRTLHLSICSKNHWNKNSSELWCERPWQNFNISPTYSFFSGIKGFPWFLNPPFKRGQIGCFFQSLPFELSKPSRALRLHCWWSLLHMHCWAPESFSTRPCRRIPYPQRGMGPFSEKPSRSPRPFYLEHHLWYIYLHLP